MAISDFSKLAIVEDSELEHRSLLATAILIINTSVCYIKAILFTSQMTHMKQREYA